MVPDQNTGQQGQHLSFERPYLCLCLSFPILHMVADLPMILQLGLQKRQMTQAGAK